MTARKSSNGESEKPIPDTEEILTPDDPWRIEPAPKGLIDSPLDFIFAEHHRQRRAAMILMKIAYGEFNQNGVEELVEFLETDFALHIGDEEVVLFPVLREHCTVEDNIDAIIEKLVEEHREDEASSDYVVSSLKMLLAGQALKGDARGRLMSFAEHIRQHLALENGVLLPIARVRLRTEELRALAEMLKQRRERG